LKKIGITGQNGFIGYHLYHTLQLYKEDFILINFEKSFFQNDSLLDSFVSNCDVIVHLAALNRHDDQNILYQTNLDLATKLLSSLQRTKVTRHLVVASSTQEENGTNYGKSKKETRLLFSEYAKKNGLNFSGLVIPNVFGPFGKPFYNSVVATFSHQLTHEQEPKIEVDGILKLIYVGELVKEIINQIQKGGFNDSYSVPHTLEISVSQILLRLSLFKKQYFLKGDFPKFENIFDLHLFNTFRSYIDVSNHFPKLIFEHKDQRGQFFEIVRHESQGQISFSTTLQGITRGNHFHTRKIERFCVVKGKAEIQLRQIGTDKVHSFILDGERPAYVDMPVWFTHNIKNIGECPLYTIFWINEHYNPENPDTYSESV